MNGYELSSTEKYKKRLKSKMVGAVRFQQSLKQIKSVDNVEILS